MLVGAHVSTAGGLVKAHERGVEMGALALAWPMMAGAGLVGAGLAFGVAQGAGAAYSMWSMLREGVLRANR